MPDVIDSATLRRWAAVKMESQTLHVVIKRASLLTVANQLEAAERRIAELSRDNRLLNEQITSMASVEEAP